MNTEVIIQRNNNPPLGGGERKKWTMPALVVGEGRGDAGAPLADIKEEEEAVRIAEKRGRRKSWHSKLTSLPSKPKDKLSKAERKRRQGVVATTEEGDEGGDEDEPPLSPLSPLGFDRNKRRSWWNIFVPDDFAAASKSRRASTDIGHTFRPLHGRSKSHSVDHGTTSPIDLELLRNKMDRRFNSVGDSDGDGEKERKPSAPPIKTIPYTVQEYDTLNSVAARFDITPSELRKLNRLASNLIFPGSTLLVPDKSPTAPGEDGPGDGEKSVSASEEGNDSSVDEKEILDSLRPASPKPGHVERIARRPDPREARFLKINVRHITDGQGVVAGVLLVTPNAVMFDPNVSDPLVIEQGPESYGVIAPMEYVVNAAIYYDIAHMRVGASSTTQSGPQPEIYYIKPPEKERTISESLLVKEGATGKGSSDGETDSLSSYADREGHPPSRKSDQLLGQVDESAKPETEPESYSGAEAAEEPAEPPSELSRLKERRASSLDQHWAVPKKKNHSDSLDSQPESDSLQLGETAGGVEDGEPPAVAADGLTKLSCHDSGIDMRESEIAPTRKARSDADVILAGKDECVLLVDVPKPRDKEDKPIDGQKTKRLSYPLSWMEGSLHSDSKDEKDPLPSLPTSADSQHSSVFSKVFSRRSSVGTFMRSSTSGSSEQDGRNLSRTTTPKLDYRSMVSVDDMPGLFASIDKLIPRPARSCDDPPLYLRLRMGKPLNKKIPKSTPIMSYGKKKMRPEYWFSVPRNRVDELFHFLQVWVPQLYGDLEKMDVTGRGFELVESDTELWDEEQGVGEDGTAADDDDEESSEMARPSWEVLSMSEELRRALYASSVGSLDLDLFIPDLVGVTEILTEDHRRQLSRHLPARAEGYLWTLVFSTSQHGFSLNSLYRKMTRVESPILLVVQDTENNVFGAITSCSLKVSDYFYGTGESLLFRFNPEFNVYQWTGDNMYFIKGNNESLAIGAGDGKFGLWLDGDLYQGRSERCSTYDNAPLSSQEDFVVKTLECWAFL